MAELAASASADGEFLEGADVVNKNVHHAELVAEAEQEMQARRMERDRRHLVCEVPDNVKRLRIVIPEKTSNYIRSKRSNCATHQIRTELSAEAVAKMAFRTHTSRPVTAPK